MQFHYLTKSTVQSMLIKQKTIKGMTVYNLHAFSVSAVSSCLHPNNQLDFVNLHAVPSLKTLKCVFPVFKSYISVVTVRIYFFYLTRVSFCILLRDIIKRFADVMLLFGFMHVGDATAVRNNAQLTYSSM